MEGHELIRRFEEQFDEWDLWQSDPTEAFERYCAEPFYRETGMMAPGKSVPLEMSNVDDDAKRRQAYNEWGQAKRAERHKMMRDVLALLKEAIKEQDGKEPVWKPIFDMGRVSEGLRNSPTGGCDGTRGPMKHTTALLVLLLVVLPLFTIIVLCGIGRF